MALAARALCLAALAAALGAALGAAVADVRQHAASLGVARLVRYEDDRHLHASAQPRQPRSGWAALPGVWLQETTRFFTTAAGSGDAHSVGTSAGQKPDRVPVVSGWLLMHSFGNHTSALVEPELPLLVASLQGAVADSLEVCRPAVKIIDVRAVNVDIAETTYPYRAPTEHKSVVQKWANSLASVMRGWSNSPWEHPTLTQIRAVYEIRVFDEMRVTEKEVKRRIDRYQAYGPFVDLGRLISKAFGRSNVTALESAGLDDAGYAAGDLPWKPRPNEVELEDCLEEGRLRDARRYHQYALALCLILVALTTCAGSAIFTIKHASVVPSRLNPLSGGSR